jgi:HK97 family phage portal protein
MIDRLKNIFLRKQSHAGAVIYHSQQQPKWMARRYKSFADEGYTKNVIAYQGIKKISDTAAGVPLMLKRRDVEITDSPLLRLLERPNPVQSGNDLIRSIVGFYCISGNAYIEKLQVGREPRELYALRSDRVKVKPGVMGWPKGYEYSTGQDSIQWDVDQSTGLSDILHLKTFNPLDDWYGLSPLEAGAYAIDQHNLSMGWMQALLQNGAAPSGAMTSSDELSDESFNRLKAQIDEQYTGASNAGRPMLLEGGMSWQSMGFNPDQMAAIETRHASARDVSLALGVPPLLLGIPGDSTYNNYKEARLALYEETVIPLIENICDGLNNWLVPMYGDNLRLVPDVDSIAAIADKRREMWSMADASSDLTINEKREIKGYGPVEGGDTVLVNASLIPISFATEPAPDLNTLSSMGAAELKALAYGEQKQESHAPNDAMAAEANRGLEWRREYNRGGTEIGVARARDISNKKNLPIETVARMSSFFARHEESSKGAEGFKPGEDGYPSAGRIAWALWGGDPGKAWAESIMSKQE